MKDEIASIQQPAQLNEAEKDRSVLQPNQITEAEKDRLEENDNKWLLVLIDRTDEAKAEERLNALRPKLMMKFAVKGFKNTEDLASRTITIAIEKLKSGTPLTSTFEAYCIGIADKLALEENRKRKNESRNVSIEDLPHDREPAGDSDVTEANYNEKLRSILAKCLRGLSKKERKIALRYYGWRNKEEKKMDEARKKLADEMAIDISMLRSRMLRLRKRLGSCVKNHLG